MWVSLPHDKILGVVSLLLAAQQQQVLAFICKGAVEKVLVAWKASWLWAGTLVERQEGIGNEEAVHFAGVKLSPTKPPSQKLPDFTSVSSLGMK